MKILPHESIILSFLSFLAVLGLAVRFSIGVETDFVFYSLALSLFCSMISFCLWLRRFKNNIALSLYLTSFIIFLFLGFVSQIYVTAFLPVVFPRVDHILIELDALLGFQWQETAIFFSHIPYSAETMSLIYNSAVVQLLSILIVLSVSIRPNELGTFLITVVLSVVITIAVWIFFPSFGASSVYDLPEEVLGRMPIIVDPAYGKDLVTMSIEGMKTVSPDSAKGAIGFPSFHAVMAAICVTFSRPFKIVWPFAIVLNVLMVPCIIVQGGHHLVDVIAGVAVFFVGYVAALKLMKRINAPAVALASKSPVSGVPQSV